MLNGLAEDMQRLLIRNTMNKLFDIGIKAGTSWVSSLFGASASGPSTAGTPVTARPTTYDTAGWNASGWGNAHGNAFYTATSSRSRAAASCIGRRCSRWLGAWPPGTSSGGDGRGRAGGGDAADAAAVRQARGCLRWRGGGHNVR